MEIAVSVIIPVYNSERYLEQALDSVLEQTGLSLEIICVDDDSTDGSLSILRRYAVKDSRVQVYTQQNQHAGMARNHGMEKARGAYIAFLDADDYYLPGVLSILWKKAVQNRLDMIKGSFLYLDTQTSRQYQTLESTNSCIGARDRGRVLSFADRPRRLLNVADVPWNGLYRKAFLEQNNIRFNSLICVNDHSFFINCLLKAERLMVCDNIVACYRIGQSGSLIGKKAQHFDAQLDSVRIVETLCRNVRPEWRTLVMRNEINGLFTWYQRLRAQTEPKAQLDQQMSDFLRGFDEAEVGVDFLLSRTYREIYWSLRYGMPPPDMSKGMLIMRAWQCLQEHGWRYTARRLMARTKGEQE